jgi:DNA ligase-1
MRTLYTRDASGAVRFWRMEVDGSRYRSLSGVLGGAEVPTGWTTATPKNVGRSNETSAEQQAQLEVDAHYRNKLDRKYHESADNVGAHKFFAPMLAQKFEGSLPANHAYVQPKLDGYRCIASAGGLTSRQGKQFFLPHIEAELRQLFADNPDVVLDGELYNHDLRDDFNTLGSLIKKQGRTPEQEERVQAMVQYHVYDLPSHAGNFGDRLAELLSLGSLYLSDRVVKPVKTPKVVSLKAIDDWYSQFLLDGYEGQMVRLDAPYEVGKRSKHLLKRKEFQDEEFELVRVEEGEGNWAGYAKRAVIRLKDGREAGAGIKGNQAFTADLLQGWTKFNLVTVRYFALTPDGVPRFPVAVDWHEGKREY